MRREFATEDLGALYEVMWHPSCWVWGCRRHHGNFDARHLRITRAQVPEVTERYAEVFGFEHVLDRMYGEKPYVERSTDDDGGEW
jgi:hypothetical protein